jgi:thiamine biosynthesis lipoprotein
MATVWRLDAVYPDGHYAGQAAAAVWREVDACEAELSRFVETSDVARLARARAGEPVLLGERAWDCLALAAEAWRETAGAFDPVYRAGPEGGWTLLAFDPAAGVAVPRRPGLPVDLGGIGKGFALERAAAVLADWEIDAALLSAGGGSSVLALGPPPSAPGWEILVGGQPRRLVRRAASGAGLAVQGEHVWDPRTGDSVARRPAAWCVGPSAALADAFATALLLLPDDGVAALRRRRPDYEFVTAGV